MKNIINKIGSVIFGALAMLIGLYAFSYLVLDMSDGLLSQKSQELLNNTLWNIGLYGHLTLGGIALFIGWTQFSSKLRKKRMNLHRALGKAYVISVLISGICAVYIGFYATGGMVSSVGFISLGLIWLSSTYLAYTAIKNGNLQTHQNMMIVSYAACFSAVTLRLWLPILIPLTGNFVSAYQIVAWLCWVPNLAVASFLIKRNSQPNLAKAKK